MVYRTHPPRPPLSDFVDLFWFYGGYAPPHARERVLPDGAMALIISLRDDGLRVYDRHDTERSERLGTCVVCGVRSQFAIVDTTGQAPSMGVRFKPGAGCHLLEQAHLSRVARPLARHPAVALALADFQRRPQARVIAAAQARTGLSHSRFLRLFRDEVGLPPKLFCRIWRLQRLLRAIDHRRRVAWAEVALRCGYFDQPHLIHDFRAFAGLSPRAYLARRGAHRNHVVLGE